ncbi:MAG: DUF885 family protein [Thermoanaerobaculia bacterium]|nr:DUF885 family protein [Thermoanaerobaculia bacterium]
MNRAAGLVAFGLLLGCSPAPPAQPPGVVIGASAYQAILRAEAELDWSAEQLAQVARAEARFVDGRRDALARRLGDADGRAALARLQQDHPKHPDAVLGGYRDAVARARDFVASAGFVTVPPGRPLQVVATPTILPPERYPFVAYLGDKLAVAPEAGPLHCRACVPAVVAHEAYPGHHVAFLVRRTPRPPADPELSALANHHRANRFHAEGWGQYAEVLMIEAGFYAGDPEAELGAWSLLHLRLRRAELDAELHAERIDGAELVRILVDELGMPRVTAEAELAHHLAEPTLKASYLVGLLQILTLRAELERRSPGFDRRAFHDQLLAWPLPWPEVARRFFGVERLEVPTDGAVLVRTFGEGL